MGYNETPMKGPSMDYIAITKKIVSTIIGIGTTKIVAGIIENNVDTDPIAAKVTVGAASVVIGYAASDFTSSYTDAKIDEALVWWTENVTKRSQ